MKNQLHFGDNLEVMQDMPSEIYHLTYLDPPFNSGRNYNIFLGDSKAQKKAFDDTWYWDETAIKIRDDISNYDGRYSELEPIMERLDECLTGFDYILKGNSYGDSMRAYLAFMGIRLAEIWRLLNPTGSIYLHCDPTASHYLKGLMDAIFGAINFQNEIIWHYQAGTGPKTAFKRKHDTIFFYRKSSKSTFNRQSKPVVNPNRYKHVDEEGRAYDVNGQGRRYYLDEGQTCDDVWTYIQESQFQQLNSQAKERLGYPTQKPRALLERIIKASSDPGQIIFDPFCGCGTTIDAAHGLNRQWIGIDLTVLALEPMERRLRERHGLEPRTHYTIEGYPTTYEDAKLLAERNAHDFANWAVTRLGLRPTKDVGDGGLDGTGKMLLYENRMVAEKQQKKVPIIAEVKSGNPTIGQVREFRTVMRDQNATIGVFITLGRVTSSMRQEVEKEGFIELNAKRYPRLQFWQIDDIYFKTGQIPVELPYQIDTRPKAERHHGEQYQTLF